ncbi:MAG TPA: PaaI family thioesterase [Rhizomicrobium sp.]|nr:PaaI family thioesterase [Rhizomicrobium sp.]
MSEPRDKPTGVAGALGMEKVVERGENGRAVIHYRARMDMCHSGGIVQGGFVTGWIDAAMAHVVMAQSEDAANPLSLEIKVSFLNPATPGLIIAEAWIERSGKSIAFLEGLIKNEAGVVLAKATSTMKLVQKRTAP